MMDIKQKILSVLSLENPLRSAEIRNQTGLTQTEMSPVLKELVSSGQVIASYKWEYTLGGEPNKTNLAYLSHKTKAEELEAKNLWRRAAAEWRSAFDCTAETHLRTIAANQVAKCNRRSKAIREGDDWVLSGNFVGNVSSVGDIE